ncbi:hypothetical protein BVRB_005670 [Beta vulgaris subsp. vulgaris]|uniref:Gnk2-homologous domain-containing protein n=1 Tax=Beta vulgaris subsp. vulgaris TaxID=3555 RepID=A0A0J8DXX5_BETVV|nr:cysteine-rich repeat secretory protein 55 [Beta vulgaris subsp. vulgaris]KMS95725.1 hypothetical protein BVRB_005670 [Beta vulgaris subsp. vulgaris]
MASQLFHVLVLLILTLTFTYTSADEPQSEYCNPNTMTSSSSPISANIDHLLANVVTKFQQGATYVKAASGKGDDTVYGLAQCRGDVGSKDCLSCIKDVAQRIRKTCPSQSEAWVRYEYCYLKYSQDNFYGKVDTSTAALVYYNTQNVIDPKSFSNELGKLFDKIVSRAVKPSSGGLGKDETKLSDFETLYGLVQCNKDLSPVSCGQCLAIAIQNFEGFCKDSQGCRVVFSSCFVRYELYPFYFPLDGQSSIDKGHSVRKPVMDHH